MQEYFPSLNNKNILFGKTKVFINIQGDVELDAIYNS